MDVVSLPVVMEDATVTSALELLRHHDRSGLIVDRGAADFLLHYAGDLLRARDAGIEHVAGVDGGHPVLLTEQGPSLVRNLVGTPQGERLESLMDSQGREYAVVAGSLGDGEMVEVVTRHERQTQTLMAGGGYQCSRTPPHYFPEPRVKLGQACPLCPRAGGATIGLA